MLEIKLWKVWKNLDWVQIHFTTRLTYWTKEK